MFNRIKQTEEMVSEPMIQPVKVPRMTLTVEELAEELNISSPTAYSLVKQETFPSFHIGQRILINRAGLQRWIDEQCERKSA